MAGYESDPYTCSTCWGIINLDGCSMVPEDGALCECDDNPVKETLMKQLIADHSLTYVHTASDGKKTIVLSDGLNRWHLIEGSERTMALPSTPTDIAGRYALDFYDLTTRRGYRRFHDDYMLADTQPRTDAWSFKKAYPYRAQFRISGKVWHR